MLDRFWIVLFGFESGLEDEIAAKARGVAVLGVEFFARVVADCAVLVECFDGDDVIEHFKAHRAGVHAQRAADVAGDAFHPFEATELGFGGGAGEFFEANARA